MRPKLIGANTNVGCLATYDDAMRRRTLLVGTVVALVSSGALAGTQLEVGEPFPALTLPSMADGKPMSISDFHGRKVILQVCASW